MTDTPTRAPDLGPEQIYFQYLQAGDWRLPRCQQCQRACFHPRVACPACGGTTFDWFRPDGRGRVYSTTVMRRPAEAGGDRHLCLVDLDEGVRMMSRVVGVPPDAVRIGDRVRAELPPPGHDGQVWFRHEEASA